MAKKLAKVRVQIVDVDTKLPKEDVDVITSADCVYFPDGETFQQKWENGDFQGIPGEDGAAATIRVGNTTTIDPGNKAIVENVGTKSAAVLNFKIPKGEKGDPGTSIKILGRFNTYEELVAMYPDGSDIDGGFLVGPEEGPCQYYFWDTLVNKWVSMGPIRGPQGEVGEKGDPGKDGMGLAILTSVPNYAKLIELYPDGSVCNGWGIITLDTREYWFWDYIKLVWKSAGSIIGQKGEQGDPGKAGTIMVGKVTTSESGTHASVINVGNEVNAILDFVIPKGDKGDPGKDGDSVSFEIDSEIKKNSPNPVSGHAVYNELIKYALQSHEHLYAGSNNPGGAANSALKCTGNSATATGDSDGNKITATYVAGVDNTTNAIKFLSKSGSSLFEINKSNIYNLPTATSNTLGGVKIDNDSISISNGTIYVKNKLSVVASGQVADGAYVTCPSTINGDSGILLCVSYNINSGSTNAAYAGVNGFKMKCQKISKGSQVQLYGCSSVDGGGTTYIEYWILA